MTEAGVDLEDSGVQLVAEVLVDSVAKLAPSDLKAGEGKEVTVVHKAPVVTEVHVVLEG